MYFAEFETETKTSEEKVILKEGYSLFHLIKVVLNKHPSLKSIIWDQNKKKISDRFSVVKNKTVVSNSDFRMTRLTDGDIVSFIMPIAGG